MINKPATEKMNTEALLIARTDGWGEVDKFFIKLREKMASIRSLIWLFF